MLSQGIPAFRLPRDIIEQEIDQITGLGVEILCNMAIGSDVLLPDLLERFDAVVMAAGALKPNLLNLPGHELAGIRHGLDFLQEINETGTADVGRSVIVIGGGFTAMDCARTAQRMGIQTAQWDLKVLYRRTRSEMHITPGELEELETERIPLECQANPLAYLGVDGNVAGMRFQRAETGEEFEVPADAVLLATGQFPDFSWAGDVVGIESANLNSKLFAAGDYAQGATSLINAIGHAKRVVLDVDSFLTGQNRMETGIRVENATETGRIREMDSIERQPMPTLPLTDRDLPSEVEQGYEIENAAEEAKRCYRCNFKFEIDQEKCIKCDWCLKAKPRPECILMLKELKHDEEGRVVSWEATETVREMKLIWINSDECIRCGACIKACPVDAINLQKVSLCTEPLIKQNAAQLEINP
jgi:formate dehydrogenase major subunit